MILATVKIMLPSPVVFDGHELVHIHGVAVDESFILNINALGEIVCLRALV
jgi:hypothetical protein